MQSEVTEVTPFLRNLTAFLSLLILMSICLKTFLYLPQSQVVPVTQIVITNNNKNEENHFFSSKMNSTEMKFPNGKHR